MQHQHQRTLPPERSTPRQQATPHQGIKRSARSVVVGVDRSPASDAAIEWAAHQADLKHTGLLLVQVRPKGLGSTASTDDQAPWRPMPGRLATRIAERFGISVEGIVRDGAVLDGLAAAAEGAQLLVLGRSGAKSGDPAFRQPLAYRCAQVVSCPVVTVPVRSGAEVAPGPGQLRSVIVGLDSSPESWAALNWAVTEARVRHCACEVVHVADTDGTGLGNGLHSRRTAQALVDRAVEYAAYCGVQAQGTLLSGPTAGALLQVAFRADLLVLGGRLRSKADRLVHRDVAARCVRASACPVVIVTTHPVGGSQPDAHQTHKKTSGSTGRRGMRQWAEKWPIDLAG